MAISQPKAIARLYNEVVLNGQLVPEDEKIEVITALCEKKGQFIFHIDSYWSFVKTKFTDKKCIRMIFALKENVGGKVHNIDRIVELIKNIEKTLIFVDRIHIVKRGDFIYLDVIKYTPN
jgi:hypothetical protein